LPDDVALAKLVVDSLVVDVDVDDVEVVVIVAEVSLEQMTPAAFPVLQVEPTVFVH
jgi:hypothetical protein